MLRSTIKGFYMGLDMYLTRKIYVGNSDKYNVSIVKDGQPLDSSKIISVVEEFGYWRKANAIHNWMVKNIQKGKDDCGEYYLTREDIKSLHDICQKVLDDYSMAEELLPTTSGFFFGDTEYNELYFEKIKNTLEICKNALLLEEGSFYYSSSW